MEISNICICIDQIRTMCRRALWLYIIFYL